MGDDTDSDEIERRIKSRMLERDISELAKKLIDHMTAEERAFGKLEAALTALAEEQKIGHEKLMGALEKHKEDADNKYVTKKDVTIIAGTISTVAAILVWSLSMINTASQINEARAGQTDIDSFMRTLMEVTREERGANNVRPQ